MIDFNHITILSWNIKGAANGKAKRHVKDLIRKLHPTLFFILETHVQFRVVATFWRNLGYKPVAIVEASGQAGGIWVLNSDDEIDIEILDLFHQAVSFKISKDDKSWICSAVCASPIPSIRSTLWDHLTTIRSSFGLPWLLVGDFNEILLPSEVMGGNFVHARAYEFAKVLENCDLLDLGTSGSVHTWYINNQGMRRISKRLDRAIADCNWRVCFPEAVVETLSRLHLDHSLILVRCGGFQSRAGHRPFRFEAAWSTHLDYHAVVDDAWKKGGNNVVAGLAEVRDDSLLSNSAIFGNIFRKKHRIEARLRGIQRSLENIDSAYLILLEQELQRDYNAILREEEYLWYQKSREKWVRFGDRNTKFFHTQTIVRRRRNHINGLLLDDGSWCKEDDRLKEEALAYFHSLFCPPVVDSPYLQSSYAPCLNSDEANVISGPVTINEVKGALRSMKSFKSPGPDEFQPVFFKSYWDIIGNDVWHFLNNAILYRRFDIKVAETLIALIPKVNPLPRLNSFAPSVCAM